jgi:hypothetical protein
MKFLIKFILITLAMLAFCIWALFFDDKVVPGNADYSLIDSIKAQREMVQNQ